MINDDSGKWKLVIIASTNSKLKPGVMKISVLSLIGAIPFFCIRDSSALTTVVPTAMILPSLALAALICSHNF